MQEYTIINTKTKEYKKMIICLSHESILEYINKIEKTLTEEKIEGKILIDQLLITGNNNNRFCEIKFTREKFNQNTAQNITPKENYKKMTTEYFNSHYEFIKNSILTDEEKQKIKNNITI